MKTLMIKPRFSILGALAITGFMFATAVPAQAQDANLDSLLNTMKTTRGEDYLTARDTLIAKGDDARFALRQRLSKAKWSATSWQDDWAAAAALTWLERGDICLRAYKLQGLDPAAYQRRRNGKPSIHRELAGLDLNVVAPVLIEILTKTSDIYPLASVGKKTKTVEEKTAQQKSIAAERLALREGCLLGLARSKHPAASFVLAASLQDTKASLAIRRTSALSLGEVGPAGVEALAAVARDKTADVSLRAAALAGVSKIRTEAPFAILQEAIASGPLTLRKSAIQSLGNYAGSWSWYGRPAELADRVRSKAARELVALVKDPDFDALQVAITTSLKTIDHPAAAKAMDDIMATLKKADTTIDPAIQKRADLLKPAIRKGTASAPK